MNPMLRQKVRAAIAQKRLLAPGEHVVVAVSGGADSMALLYALDGLRRDWRLALTIAHLDHGIRADTSEDLRVVRWAAEDLGLPLICEKRDVPSLAKREKRNLEEAARRARREFLEEVARRVGAGKIALGHTRTDLAETVLLHLLRGTGPGGLRGFLPSAPPYIRPLLLCSREETRAFCRKHGIPFHDDPTNLDTRLLRNAIRLELLPFLARFSPRAEEALARAAELWAEAEEALAWAADRALMEVQDGSALNLAELLRLPAGVQGLVVRAAARRAGSTLLRRHVDAIREALGRGGSAELHLPGGLHACIGGGKLAFVRLEEIPPGEMQGELPLEGEAAIPNLGWRFRISRTPRPRSLVPPHPFVAYLDPGKVRPPLLVRTPRRGDRLRPLGMSGTKKVSELLMEARIPRWERARWPLLCDQAGIAWVVGVRLADGYKLDLGTAEALRVEAERA